MSLKKLAGETAIYGLSHILPRILNFLVMTVYLTYKFENQADFGIFSDLYAYATIIISLMVFRMDTAYFRFATKAGDLEEEKVYTTTFTIMALVSIMITISMIVFKQPIATLLGYQQQAHYIVWFAYILAFDAFTTLIYAKFRLQRRPMRFFFFRLANVVLTIVFVFVFLEILPSWYPEIRSYFNQLLNIEKDLDYVFLANLLASLMVFILMAPEFLKLKNKFDWSLSKQILKYSWPLVIIIVAGNINQYIAVPIQNFLLEGDVSSKKAISGIYSAGAKLAILLNLFTTAFNYAAEPFFFNQALKDDQHTMNGIVAKTFTMFSALVILLTYFYVDIVLLLIGQSYRDGVIVVPVLLFSYMFLGLYYNISIWYKLADKTIYGAIIAIGGVLVTLFTSAMLIPVIGMMGSAWASLACFAYMAVIGYWLGQKHFPISYPVISIATYILITALLLFVSWLVREHFSSIYLRLAINSILLLLFCIYVYIFEKAFLNKYLIGNKKVLN